MVGMALGASCPLPAHCTHHLAGMAGSRHPQETRCGIQFLEGVEGG